MSESLIRRLRELPVAEPDVRRAEHITLRCRTHLARPTRRGLILGTPPTRERIVPVWQSLIAVLGFVYLAEVIAFAFSVYGLS